MEDREVSKGERNSEVPLTGNGTLNACDTWAGPDQNWDMEIEY